MLTAPTSSALFVVVANEDNENRAVGLVVSTWVKEYPILFLLTLTSS